jgi:ElaA protein
MKQIFEYSVKPFRELSAIELYAVIRLRNEVFVVEQNCVFQDADNKDLYCYHVMLYDNKELIAYARLMPPGIAYKEMSIGRVVTKKTIRRTGAGKQLMNLAIQYCRNIFGDGPIRIGAQYYLKDFYSQFGFNATGDTYDEDGIEHIEMIKHK